MNKFGWCAVWGLCLLQLSLAQIGKIDLNVTCRYAGVFHVEKNGRYSISRTEAADLCKAFDCTLPTMAQMEEAWRAGFETCRYGFIEGHVVIPRIHPNPICAANNTGVYILTSNTSQYDTYCYNASAPQGEDCTAITNLTNAFDGEVSISIVNRDGTRYTQKGEYRTNPDDINNTTAEYDTSSGSYSERSTPESYIIHTHFPTAHPTQDQDSPGVSYYPEDTPDTSTDSNIITAGWKPTEENEDERDKHPIHSGSGIDDDEDFISSTISTTPRVSDHSTQNRNGSQWSPGFLNPEVSLQTTTRMTDVDRSGTSDYGENWTQEAQSPLTHHEHHDEAATQHSASTISAHDTHPNQRTTTPSEEDSSWTYFLDPISHPMGRGHQTESRIDMDSSHSTTLQPSADSNTHLAEDWDRTGPLPMTTQQSHTQSFSTSHGGFEEDKDQPMMSTPTSSNRHDGGGGHLPEDSATSVGGYTPHSPDTKEYTTLIPVTPANTESPGVTEVTVDGDSNVNVDGPLPEDGDSSSDPRDHTTQRSGPTGHSSGSQEGGANTTSGPIRKPQIPEWLIILASLLALALILAVCIAVNSRRRCGQKKKLVINGNGAVEDRKPSGLNGEASKSQEMVHLVNKEPSETPDQCMTADETRNLQNVDMKIGV
ncbi:PREDICTED: CD44 antigen isoform X3 [Myotis brandtii]|uniref:CD44 antigen isoform X3 n=1 Tax=Myotis brandtii TaxID=109478 RepID=UPI000703F385|nr:PREDICTED: CD44 antigen isoform X3 [Myotis brandtii]